MPNSHLYADLGVLAPFDLDVEIIRPAHEPDGLTRREMHECGKSKVEVFKWTTEGGPGRFAIIHKSLLNFDETYQRTENKSTKRIRNIRAVLKPVAFGAITVVRRRDGSLWVPDGMHRSDVALDRADVQYVPAILFEEDDLETPDGADIPSDSGQKEAEAFLNINTCRGALKAIDKYKALLVVGDPKALRMESLLQEAGLRVSSGRAHGTIRCVATLLRFLNYLPLAETRQVWRLIVNIHAGEQLNEEIVKGCFYQEYALRKYAPEHSILQPHHQKRLIKLGKEGVLRYIRHENAFYQRGGELVNSDGITKALNFGRRTKLIPSARDLSPKRGDLSGDNDGHT